MIFFAPNWIWFCRLTFNWQQIVCCLGTPTDQKCLVCSPFGTVLLQFWKTAASFPKTVLGLLAESSKAKYKMHGYTAFCFSCAWRRHHSSARVTDRAWEDCTEDLSLHSLAPNANHLPLQSKTKQTCVYQPSPHRSARPLMDFASLLFH